MLRMYMWCVVGLGLNIGLPSLAQPAVTYNDVKPILDQHCVGCHAGSLDLRSFPFQSAHATQEALVADMIRRFRLQTWQRMPPPRVQESPLPDDVIAVFEQWLLGGLKPY